MHANNFVRLDFHEQTYRDLFTNSSALHFPLSIRVEYNFHRKWTFTVLYDCMRIFRMTCRIYHSAIVLVANNLVIYSISSTATLRENVFPRRAEMQLATLDESRAKYMVAYSTGASYYINLCLMISLITTSLIKICLSFCWVNFWYINDINFKIRIRTLRWYLYIFVNIFVLFSF